MPRKNFSQMENNGDIWEPNSTEPTTIYPPWHNSGLLSFAKAMRGTYPEGEFGYVWGAQGQEITEDVLLELERICGPNGSGSPGYYHQDRTRQWIGKKAADCSGLIMYIFTLAGIYDWDRTADMLMGECDTTVERQPGDLLFKMKGSRAVHVGIAIEENKAVHCRGTKYGLVTTEEWEYGWDRVGRYPNFPQIKFVDAIDKVREDM